VFSYPNTILNLSPDLTLTAIPILNLGFLMDERCCRIRIRVKMSTGIIIIHWNSRVWTYLYCLLYVFLSIIYAYTCAASYTVYIDKSSVIVLFIVYFKAATSEIRAMLSR